MKTKLHHINAKLLNQIRYETKKLLDTCKRRDDSDYLICHSLNRTHAWLYAHPEYQLNIDEKQKLEENLTLCLQSIPLSQIKSHKEFFSMGFEITSDVLTPRPETEILVEQALLYWKNNAHVIDLGTGCGNIATAIKRHQPNWHVTATDISHEALKVAKRNALTHQLHDITFIHSDWLSHINQDYDVIISNPPYIAREDLQVAPDVAKYEPSLALYADNKGLSALQIIIEQAGKHISSDGWLILEHGYNQAEDLCNLLNQSNFNVLRKLKDLSGHQRVIIATPR